MKKATIKIQDGAAAEIGMTEAQIMTEVITMLELAEDIAKDGVDRLATVLTPKKKKAKKQAWGGDALIKRFFGRDAPTIAQMRKTHRRLERAYNRIANKKLTIRVRKQPNKAPDRKAQNLGSIFSPKRFKVYPALFGTLDAEYDGFSAGDVSSDSNLRRAAVIIHELNHDLYIDYSVGGKKVYGEAQAKKLARDKPRKSRKSGENFEWFCMRLRDPSGNL